MATRFYHYSLLLQYTELSSKHEVQQTIEGGGARTGKAHPLCIHSSKYMVLQPRRLRS
jgi:hypothetical protein